MFPENSYNCTHKRRLNNIMWACYQQLALYDKIISYLTITWIYVFYNFAYGVVSINWTTQAIIVKYNVT